MTRKTGAFSLVEMICALVIVGILVTLCYVTFTTGGGAIDYYATRAELWQDMDRIIDEVTLQTRAAASIAPSNSSPVTFVTFYDGSNAALGTCGFDAAGVFTLTRAGVSSILTTRVDPALSSFTSDGKSLKLSLVLAGQIASGRVEIATSTEIYARN